MSRFWFDVLALLVVGGCIYAALRLHYRHKRIALEWATYRAIGDTLHQRKVSLVGRKVVWVCRYCGIPEVDLKAHELHIQHHKDEWQVADRVLALEKLVAEQLGGVPVEDVKPVPWTAATEPVAAPSGAVDEALGGVDVTPGELDSAERAAQWAGLRDRMEKINR